MGFSTIHQKENTMTATTQTAARPITVANPHRIPTLITGWAVIAVFLGALWGAGHHPDDAAWSAFAVIAMIGIYLYNKARKVTFDRRHRGAK